MADSGETLGETHDGMQDMQARVMSAIDTALQPAHRLAKDSMGPVHHAQMAHYLNCIRQALAHLVYGPPEAPAGESLDVKGEQDAAAEADRVAAEQLKADGPKEDITA